MRGRGRRTEGKIRTGRCCHSKQHKLRLCLRGDAADRRASALVPVVFSLSAQQQPRFAKAKSLKSNCRCDPECFYGVETGSKNVFFLTHF